MFFDEKCTGVHLRHSVITKQTEGDTVEEQGRRQKRQTGYFPW